MAGDAAAPLPTLEAPGCEVSGEARKDKAAKVAAARTLRVDLVLAGRFGGDAGTALGAAAWVWHHDGPLST